MKLLGDFHKMKDTGDLPLQRRQTHFHHESLGKHCSFIHTKIRTPSPTDLLSETRNQGPQRALPLEGKMQAEEWRVFRA